MTWKKQFDEGVTLFKAGNYPEALQRLNQAVANGGECHFILYDTRAAVYESLENPKAALKDAKTTIKLAPQRWQGYARAARLFEKTHRFDASLKMIGLALSYVRPEDTKRREELLKIQVEITDYQETVVTRERRMRNHMLLLPVEIYNEIFECILKEDHAQIITLLHVCAHWRQIVWDSPGLWRTLVLSKSRRDKKADLWLERSRGRIRELHILSGYDPKYLPGRPSFLEKLDWSYLHVCRILSPGILKLLKPPVMFQELTALELDPDDDIRSTLDNLSNLSSTKIKSLSLHRTHFHLEYLLRPFPSLSSLSFQNCVITLTNLIEFFLANPQIESLRSDTSRVKSTPLPTVISSSDLKNPPRLENLTILEAIGDSWASIILLFDVPSLQIVRFGNLTDPQFSSFLRYWASTSPNVLTELSLDHVAISIAVVLQVLCASPTLEVLALTAMYDTVDMIINVLSGRKLLPSKDPLPILCPRLRHLDVSGCPDVVTSSVHALVKQRLELSKLYDGDESTTGDELIRQKVNRLEVLKMDRCPKIDVEWIPWFRQHVPYVTCIFASASKKQKGTARRM